MRYKKPWGATWIAESATTIGEIVALLEEELAQFREQEAAGVTLAYPVDHGYVELQTDDPDTATKFRFYFDSEGLDDVDPRLAGQPARHRTRSSKSRLHPRRRGKRGTQERRPLDSEQKSHDARRPL